MTLHPPDAPLPKAATSYEASAPSGAARRSGGINFTMKTILLLLTATIASAGDVITTLSPSDVPVIVVSRNVVLSPHHLAPHLIGSGSNVFGNLRVLKDGQPYIPAGSPTWVRYVNAAGEVKEENAANFGLRSSFHDGRFYDHEWTTTYRQLPEEAVHKLAAAAVGNEVIVHSRLRGSNVTSRVVSVDLPRSTISVDFSAEYGDSGSLVTMAGKWVGLVSSKITNPFGASIGAIVIVPEPFMVGQQSTNPPVVIPPPDTETYDRGVRDGRASVIEELQALIYKLVK